MYCSLLLELSQTNLWDEVLEGIPRRVSLGIVRVSMVSLGIVWHRVGIPLGGGRWWRRNPPLMECWVMAREGLQHVGST